MLILGRLSVCEGYLGGRGATLGGRWGVMRSCSVVVLRDSTCFLRSRYVYITTPLRVYYDHTTCVFTISLRRLYDTATGCVRRLYDGIVSFAQLLLPVPTPLPTGVHYMYTVPKSGSC